MKISYFIIGLILTFALKVTLLFVLLPSVGLRDPMYGFITILTSVVAFVTSLIIVWYVKKAQERKERIKFVYSYAIGAMISLAVYLYLESIVISFPY